MTNHVSELIELADVCFWHKADITIALPNVRYWGQSGHAPDTWDVRF
jgi:hypothetical protein